MLPWESQAFGDDNEPKKFLISICRPLSVDNTSCATNTSVCMISNGVAVSVGNYSLENLPASSTEEIKVTLLGNECVDANRSSLWKTFIVFKCGKTLGSPEFLTSYACDNYFEWKTIAACKSKGSVTPPVTAAESVCYAYDEEGRKRDLSMLIKLTGAYSVMTDDGSAMYINVCRDISAGHACGGTAACVIRNGSAVDAGRVQLTTTRLYFDHDFLMLEYSTNSTNANQQCRSGQTITTIHFKCPMHRQSSVPMRIASDGCHHQVKWDTEYACPEAYLLSNTCRLNVGQHGVEVDLTPLAATLDTPYVLYGKDSTGKVYKYKLNVCSNKTVSCLDQSTDSMACQTDNATDRSYSLGQYNQQTLRFSDGQLSLTYKNGTACRPGFPRETVIHFHCNSSAGRGSPIFSSEDQCTYIFEWETSYACITSLPDCQIYGKNMYDLSPLTRANDKANWKIYNKDGTKQLLINVCRNVTSADEGSTCPSTSAACLVKYNGTITTVVSLGQFEVAPSYNNSTQLVSLNYSNGDACGSSGDHYSTRIIFRCKPGDHSSPPKLLGKSGTSCHYELIWYTASACAAVEKFGDKCIVEDTNSGYSFDLNSLSSPSGYYMISSNKTGRIIYLNICDKLDSSPCASSSDSLPGACVVDAYGKNSKIIGNVNTALWYNNGVLKLVYGTGEAKTTRTEVIFQCDSEAGIGRPSLENEMNDLFLITWNTAYACLPEAVECSATDQTTGQYYDISSLSRSDEAAGNWVAAVTLLNGSLRHLQINFCQPVVPKTYFGNSACEPSAGACATEVVNGQEEKVAVANIGRRLFGPKIQPNGSLILEYVNGGACLDVDNKTKTYSLTITLHCDSSLKNPASLVERFSEASSRGNCEYFATLETAAACPVQSSVVNLTVTCSLTDPGTGLMYSLLPMKTANNSHFIVAVGERSLEMNFCGTLSSCSNLDASICDGKTVLGLASTAQMKLSDGVLQLVYKDDSDQVKVVVSFQCDVLSPAGTEKPTFIGLNDGIYSFDVMTSLACSPLLVVNCQAFDSMGRKYDLSPLARQNGYLLSFPGNSSEKLYINVCRTVNADNGQMCAGKRSSSCHITADGLEHSAGHLQSAPHYVNSELSIHYVNGDVCETGVLRSTRIVFICSDVEHEPSLVSDEACVYLIRWFTPFACPLQRMVGSDCQVTHPLYHGYVFNLKELHNVGSKMWHIHSSVGDFTLNVCGPLRPFLTESSCNTTENVGACLQLNNTFTNIGFFNDNLEYEDGQLLLVYSDGKKSCNGRNNRTTTIRFTCHYEQRGSNGPQFLQAESTDCNFVFNWQTSLACLPFEMTTCSITSSDGDFYDLSPLTLANDNYEVTVKDGVARLFTINVCTTLVHARGALCPLNSSACMMTAERNYTSIGAVGKSELSIESIGHLTLKYRNGDRCRGMQPYETVIKFVCPAQGEDDDLEFVSLENCTYTFFWSTKSACPIHQSSSGNCTVKDPVTGFVYDFNPLKAVPMYEINEDTDHIYFLSVCGPLVNSSCSTNNSGSCQREKSGQKRSFNAGNATSKLVLSDGMPMLVYEGGQMCHRNSKARRTIVNFVCTHQDADSDEVSSLGQPHFDMEDDCTYFMSWHTSLACQNQVRCTAQSDGQTIDLSTLMSTDDFRIEVQTSAGFSSVFMSLCRPLNKINGKRCPLGAAVCLQTDNGTLMSLGRLNSSAVLNTSTHSVSLSYVYGSKCSSDQRWTSVINFVCDHTIFPGKSVFTQIEGCQYKFEWRTSAVCGQSALVESSPADCLFTYKEMNLTFDLSSLQNKSFQVQGKSSKFILNVCGSSVVDDCSSAAVCRVYGSNSVRTTYKLNNVISESNILKVVYVQQPSSAECSLATVTLHLYCSLSASSQDSPSIVMESDCAVMLALHTPLICKSSPRHPATVQVSASPTLQTPSSSAISASTTKIINTSESRFMSVSLAESTRRSDFKLTLSELMELLALVISPISVHESNATSSSKNGLALTIGIVILCVGFVLILISSAAILRSSRRRNAVGAYLASCVQNCSITKPAGYNLLAGGSGGAMRESENLLSRKTIGNIQHYDSDDDLLL